MGWGDRLCSELVYFSEDTCPDLSRFSINSSKAMTPTAAFISGAFRCIVNYKDELGIHKSFIPKWKL